MSKRIYYLDLAKAVGIIMIIMAHVFMWAPSLSVVCSFLCSVHVPLFFVISGLLFAHFPHEEKFFVFLKKRSRQLLIPYLFFSFLNAIQTWTVLFLTHQMTVERFHIECVELLITGNGTVWFLLTLFLSELLFFYVRYSGKFNNYFIIISAILLEIIVYGLSGETNHPYWVVISRAISAYSFIVFGYYLKPIISLGKKYRLFLSIVLFVLWAYLILRFGYKFEFYVGTFDRFIYSVPIILVGTSSIILLLSCIEKQNYLIDYIGRNSLIFMLVHPTFTKIYIFLGIVYIPSCSTWMQVIISIIVLILVISGTSIFGELIKRYFPIILGRNMNHA